MLHFCHGRDRSELKGIPGEMIRESTQGRSELQYVGWTRDNEGQTIAYANKCRHYNDLLAF